VDAMSQCVRLAIDKGLVSVLKDKPKDIDRPPPKPIANPYGQ